MQNLKKYLIITISLLTLINCENRSKEIEKDEECSKVFIIKYSTYLNGALSTQDYELKAPCHISEEEFSNTRYLPSKRAEVSYKVIKYDYQYNADTNDALLDIEIVITNDSENKISGIPILTFDNGIVQKSIPIIDKNMTITNKNTPDLTRHYCNSIESKSNCTIKLTQKISGGNILMPKTNKFVDLEYFLFDITNR